MKPEREALSRTLHPLAHGNIGEKQITGYDRINHNSNRLTGEHVRCQRYFRIKKGFSLQPPSRFGFQDESDFFSGYQEITANFICLTNSSVAA